MNQLHKLFLLFVAYLFVGNILAAESTEFTSQEWWEYGHYYQIYPRSFQDSDGDGIGDLNGITSRLQHLKDINVTGVWLSPIFESPMLDMGYDISDFRKIHREYGTMVDFERLVARCKELGIKLILDFVPNHTSDQHEWFKKSADPEHPEFEECKDYFVWNDGKLLANGTRVPPSNWISIFKGSAWTWVNARRSYYLHQFMKQQPDLNFRNQNVSEEMNEVVRFWLRKGVSGFRIDAAAHLFEVPENASGLYDDEPLSGRCKDPEADCYLNHIKTQFIDESYDLINQWRSVVDEDEFKSHSRILMTEAYGQLSQITKFYGETRNGEIVKYGEHIPFNFYLTHVGPWGKSSQFVSSIETMLKALPKGSGIEANWVLGNHDIPRLASRFGPLRVDISNILLKTLPGITITYYGEEIGMTSVKQENGGDRRLNYRTPFQWDNTTNAGFSTNPKTWLKVADNYTEVNVALQQSQDVSHLKVFQKLVELRQNPTFKYGTLTIKSVSDDNVLVYKREIENQLDADIFVVVLNLSNGLRFSNIDLNSILGDLPKHMEVVVSSVHSNKLGQIIDTKMFDAEAYEGVVLIGPKP